MRYIDPINLYTKHRTWGKKNDLWKNATLKKDFREVFHNKCWYTECSLVGHDIHIDHFRPKAQLKSYESYHWNKCLESEGYEWLKETYTNYRGCCTIANRKTGKGGKGNFFPLKDGSPLLTKNGIECEEPMLLDPLVKADVKLLVFTFEDVSCATNDIYDNNRVEVSKILYNLKQFNNARVSLWNKIRREVDAYRAKQIKEDYFVKTLTSFISRKEVYSACAISCVRSLLANEPTILSQLDLDL